MRKGNLMAGSQEHKVFVPEHADQVARLHTFLQTHAEPQYVLEGNTPGERVELPQEMSQLLRSAVSAMNRGEAVTIAPYRQRLTTQQVAEFLSVSRPTVVRLLEQGEIAYEKIGKHRRVLLADLIAFQESRIAQIQESLVVIQGATEDLPASREELKNARRAVAARRRVKLA